MFACSLNLSPQRTAAEAAYHCEPPRPIAVLCQSSLMAHREQTIAENTSRLRKSSSKVTHTIAELILQTLCWDCSTCSKIASPSEIRSFIKFHRKKMTHALHVAPAKQKMYYPRSSWNKCALSSPDRLSILLSASLHHEPPSPHNSAHHSCAAHDNSQTPAMQRGRGTRQAALDMAP